MHALNIDSLRSSFVNASRKEVKDMSLPDLDALDATAWASLDYLGWRDAKFARRAYVVLPRLGGDGAGPDADGSGDAGPVAAGAGAAAADAAVAAGAAGADTGGRAPDVVGVLLTQAEAAPRTRAMCHWCRDVRLPNEVVLYAAKRAGAAGRRGDTVGVLLCRDFQCSRNVRNDPPVPYDGYDVAAARERRIDELRLRVAEFAEGLTTGK